MDKIDIACANLDDAKVLYSLNRDIFCNINYEMKYLEAICKQRLAFIAKRDGKAVGYIMCNMYPIEGLSGKSPTITSIGVIEGNRRQGMGRALLRVALGMYPKTDVYLHVRKSNVISCRLYKSEGFVVQCELVDYYKNKDGTKEDAIIMVRHVQ